MRIIVANNYEDMSTIGAEEIMRLINYRPDCVLGLATGSTPEGMYKKLVQFNKENLVDFSRVTSFNLDEYVGLEENHPQSYKYFMNNNFFDHVNINKNRTFIPNSNTINVDEECKNYDKRIEAVGGIDLQVLGIGNNGHIGFNEPSEYLNKSTHITDLTEDTINANSRFFDTVEQVPTKAITMGLAGIMKAKKILLLASGSSKAEIIYKLVKGNISTLVPASILQVHSDVLIS